MKEKTIQYIEGIGWRYETEHSMTRRMVAHDYHSRCIYMLTLTLQDRHTPLLGSLEWAPSVPSLPAFPSSLPGACPAPTLGSPSAAPGSPSAAPGSVRCSSAAAFRPSPLGEQVANEWHNLSQAYPQLQILRLQLMPDHLHVVLFVRERLPKHLGKLIGIVKNNCNKHYWQHLTSLGRLGPKGTGTPPPLFSENFQDTILTHEGQLESMIRYVADNPYRALVKRENPDLFKVVSELEVDGVRCAAIGNRWLLQRGVRLQVRCHNNATPANLRLIARQRAYFLERGEKGGVVVSPCISPGEKEIARAALEANHPLIVILENGFPPLYKPPGKYFEACAKGLLLMLAPWPYHMERRTITRSQCLALNAIAQSICDEPWTPELEAMLGG